MFAGFEENQSIKNEVVLKKTFGTFYTYNFFAEWDMISRSNTY